eukprot:3076673-Lingulodinium_polyedra.AAC.1
MQDSAEDAVRGGGALEGLLDCAAFPGADFPGGLNSWTPREEMFTPGLAESAERALVVVAPPQGVVLAADRPCKPEGGAVCAVHRLR